jgi:hypothetical protein
MHELARTMEGGMARMSESKRKRERNQLSVPVPHELRAFVERRAEYEGRTVANYVRRVLAAEAVRAQAAQGERVISATGGGAAGART